MVADWRALNHCVLQALVIAIAMIMLDELGDRPAEMALTERNHPVEALLLHGPDEPFRMGRVRRLKVRLHDAEARAGEPVSNRRAPFCDLGHRSKGAGPRADPRLRPWPPASLGRSAAGLR